MGFFDRQVNSGFDDMFDLNRDGVLDGFEQGLQFEYIDRTSRGLDPFDDSNDDEEEDEYDEILDEIEDMDSDEAMEYLESEGYDPDDFDF